MLQCTYPFEFAKTRVQLYGHGTSKNPFRIVGQVIKEEGVAALYKGCSTLIVVCSHSNLPVGFPRLHDEERRLNIVV